MTKPSVLLVEDEQHIADVVLYMLEQHGFEVRHATDGKQGLAKFRIHHPDLVLLDLNLPGLPGLELFDRIRELRPEAPVIMLTCRSAEGDRVLGLEKGADDYIVKPFSAREMVARVKTVLRRARDKAAPAADAVMRFGPFRLEKATRTLEFHDTRIDLTRAEGEIMKTLLRHPGRIFSRDELIRAAYDDGHPVTDRTVDAYMKRLRKKFAAVSEAIEPIETIYGAGYRLNPALEETAS